jgi:WD40 repeat protein
MANLGRGGSGFARGAGVLLVGVVMLVGTWSTRPGGLWDTEGLEGEAGPGSRPTGGDAEDNYGAPIWSVAFSPDDRYLAWTVMTGEVWLKDRVTGECSCIQEGVTSSARALAFSPDGRVLAVVGGGPSVRLWEVATWAEIDPLEVGGDRIKSVAFASHGRTMALGQESRDGVGGAVTVWDLADRRRLAVLLGHKGGITTLAFSPDGAVLASGDSAGVVKLWDLGSASERNSLKAEDCCIMAVAFSRDGGTLAACRSFGTAVRLWDTASAESRGALTTPGKVNCLAFSPDGRWFVTGESQGVATLWDLGARRRLGVVQSDGGPIHSVAFSRDGERLATGDGLGGVRLWNVAAAVADSPAVGG